MKMSGICLIVGLPVLLFTVCNVFKIPQIIQYGNSDDYSVANGGRKNIYNSLYIDRYSINGGGRGGQK